MTTAWRWVYGVLIVVFALLTGALFAIAWWLGVIGFIVTLGFATPMFQWFTRSLKGAT